MKEESKTNNLNPSILQIASKLTEKYVLVKSNGTKEVVIKGKKREVIDHYRTKILRDKEGHTKIFDSGFDKMAKLQNSEHILLRYIVKEIPYNQDKFFLFRSIVCKETGLIKGTLSRAIKRLLELELILPAKFKDEYYLNINDICKGSRSKMYQNYVNTQK